MTLYNIDEMQKCLLDCLSDLLQDAQTNKGVHIQLLHAVYCVIIKIMGESSRHQDVIQCGEKLFHPSIVPEVKLKVI
jgi:hypothetical protein